jgi:hypothetical protein
VRSALAPAIFWLAILALCQFAIGDEPVTAPHPAAHVRFRESAGTEREVDGEVLVVDQQGGVLLEDAAGVYWTVSAEELIERTDLAAAGKSLSADELAAELEAAVGAKCLIVKTSHFVIVTRTSRAYANWCGALFERLRTSFLEYWKKAKLPLTPPDRPLPVIILSTQKQFAEFAAKDGAPVSDEMCGYYSAKTNRIVLFDLTSKLPGQSLSEAATREEISDRLGASRASIATIVHEATHQLAFNSGLQSRYSDNPMWVSEGLAMYFESPDLKSANGWRGVGKVNTWRLAAYRQAVNQNSGPSLESVIASEDLFRDPEKATAAYAEGWALFHYLATRQRPQLVGYLKELGAKPKLKFETPETRLQEFEAAFGDVEAVEKALMKFMAQQRATP